MLMQFLECSWSSDATHCRAWGSLNQWFPYQSCPVWAPGTDTSTSEVKHYPLSNHLGIPQINVRCLLPLLPHAMGTKHFQNGDPCGSSGTGSRSVSPLRLTGYSVFLPFTHVENVKESDDSEKFIFTNSSVFTHLRANCLEMFYVKQQPRPRCIYARLSQTKCFTTWKFDEYKT